MLTIPLVSASALPAAAAAAAWSLHLGWLVLGALAGFAGLAVSALANRAVPDPAGTAADATTVAGRLALPEAA